MGLYRRLNSPRLSDCLLERRKATRPTKALYKVSRMLFRRALVVKIGRNILLMCKKMCSSRWRIEEDCSMHEVPRRRKLGVRLRS